LALALAATAAGSDRALDLALDAIRKPMGRYQEYRALNYLAAPGSNMNSRTTELNALLPSAIERYDKEGSRDRLAIANSILNILGRNLTRTESPQITYFFYSSAINWPLEYLASPSGLVRPSAS
jgi:hypothetical protein